MKILYFDYWTKGTRLFTDIDLSLKAKGHQTVFLHTGSFRDNYPTSELIDGIQVKEISHYNTMLIYKALEKIQPDVVIGLNTTYLLDRALVLACQKRSIKCMFLMHGDKPLDDQIDEYIQSGVHRNKLARKLGKVWSYAGNILPNYLYSLYKAKPMRLFMLHFLKVLWSYFKNPAKANVLPSYTDELLYDECLIYSKKYVDYYQQLGYPTDHIHIVGSPEYDSLLERIENEEFSPEQLPAEAQALGEGAYALYLEEALPEDFLGNWDHNYRNEHLKQIAEKLAAQGHQLLVKLHPNTKKENINLMGVPLIERTDLFSLVYYSRFCIGHISTTLNIPVLLNKPILVPKWDRSANFPDFFGGIKAANAWKKADDPVDLSIDTQARSKYIERNISMTKGKAADRIVNLILATDS